MCWGSTLAAITMRRKFSASAFWDDVRKFNATTFGYVGELCRYLLNQSASDQDHNLNKMVGNGLRPSIWQPFKDRFGVDTVAELYASSKCNVGFNNFFNMDNTVGFSTALYKLVKFHDGTREPIRDKKGFMTEIDHGQPGFLIGEVNKLFRYLSDNLPSYAIPVFVRVTEGIEKTDTFKYKK